MGENDENFYFDDRWKLLSSNKLIADYLYSLIVENSNKISIISESQNSVFEKSEIDGITFGWQRSINGTLLEYYFYSESISSSKEKEYEVFRKLFWKKFPSQKISIEKNEKLNIKEDLNKDFIPYKLCDKIYEEIKEYLKLGYGHSEMYVGPPGTGKSNLMKGVAANLGEKSIRFSNTDYLNSVIECVKIFRPKVIMIDDLDSCIGLNPEILSSFEQVTGNSEIVLLATANKISSMEDSIIRTGRFSRIREINILDSEVVLKLVDDDQELFTICKELPVSAIQEITKRVKTFGKKRALDQTDIGIDDILHRVKRASMNDIYKLSSQMIDNCDDNSYDD